MYKPAAKSPPSSNCRRKARFQNRKADAFAYGGFASSLRCPSQRDIVVLSEIVGQPPADQDIVEDESRISYNSDHHAGRLIMLVDY